MKTITKVWIGIAGVVMATLAVLAFILKRDGDYTVVNDNSEIENLKVELKDEINKSTHTIESLKEELKSEPKSEEDIKAAIEFLKGIANG